MARFNKKHGMSNTRIYRIWSKMKLRCSNLNTDWYKDYGGRGITYSKRWEKFENFLEDMGTSYNEKLTLERINNDKGYSKDNCRWATKEEQANNRRSSRWITYRGKTKTLAQWIKHLNLKSSTVRQRYYVYGWDIEKCLNTP